MDRRRRRVLTGPGPRPGKALLSAITTRMDGDLTLIAVNRHASPVQSGNYKYYIFTNIYIYIYQ